VGTKAKSRLLRCLVVSVVAAGTLIGFSQAASAVPVPFKNCGSAGDPVAIDQFDASVWPPQSGKPVTFNYRWHTSIMIDRGAYVVVTITLPSGERTGPHRQPFVPPPPLKRPPIPPGPYQGSVTITVPTWVRPGSVFGFHSVTFNRNGTRLSCMDLTVPIK
jgi:hypothetical protein